MKIILLSGGSGKRLWPLSNDARSKQFLRLLTGPDGKKESMIQRVVRQIRSADISDDIIIATGANQKDLIENQLGSGIPVITEPCRRDTFPAIILACSYLASIGTDMNEPVIVMPCDQYAEDKYFTVVKKMGEGIVQGVAELLLMGIKPAYPSSKYGYIVPDFSQAVYDGIIRVGRFAEKPEVGEAQRIIDEGALWNGGVFAFRLGYLMGIANKYAGKKDFDTIRNHYSELPKISFDYEVVEKAQSVAAIEYDGQWKDLGTWDTLTGELNSNVYGKVLAESINETYVINELDIPITVIGANGLVIAASHDGILVSDRKSSENLKHLVSKIEDRPMYEERRWGEYKVIDNVKFPDGSCALTKQLTLNPGRFISYQRHQYRDEIWTFIDGEGEIVLNGTRSLVKRGDVITIPKGCLHALRAMTSLSFIEVQQGTDLIEEDIERFDWEW